MSAGKEDKVNAYDAVTRVVIELRFLAKEGRDFNQSVLDARINEMMSQLAEDGNVQWVRWNYER